MAGGLFYSSISSPIVQAASLSPAILKGVLGDPLGNSELFSLGVASGDPSASSVTLWTRLAPDPLGSSDGGMGGAPVPVQFDLATDPAMINIVATGDLTSLAENGHAVHADVYGLASDTWYYYRFRALGETSRIGRTRTFPSASDPTEHMQFALASCQNYRDGYFTAYRDMLNHDIDFVLHVGDYIYENGSSQYDVLPGRNHENFEAFSVEHYRRRYAQYRLDADLQDAHAQFPFLVTWDDHEVDNNYAGLIAEENSPTQGVDLFVRRLNAYKVYAETMPLRPQNRQLGSGGLEIFRRLDFGDLASINILDTRQYRTDQPGEDSWVSADPDSAVLEQVLRQTIFDKAGMENDSCTMLGAYQESLLKQSLTFSNAHWNILAQQLVMSPFNQRRAIEATYLYSSGTPVELKENIQLAISRVSDILNADFWDGCAAARNRLLNDLDTVRPNNPVVLSGDFHSAWASHLHKNPTDTGTDLLAVEFVATSISAAFGNIDPRAADFVFKKCLPENQHIEYFNGLYRGYSLCDVTRERWQTHHRIVQGNKWSPDPTALVPKADSIVTTESVYEIASGFSQPGSGERLKKIL